MISDSKDKISLEKIRKSDWGVYSIHQRLYNALNYSKEQDIYYLVAKKKFINAPPFVHKQCKRIINEVHNLYYSLDQIALYITYKFLIDGKIPSLYYIKEQSIRETMRLFTIKQLKQDKKFVNDVREKTSIKTKNDFIQSLIILTNKKYISPMYFIDFIERNLLTKRNEHDIFIEKDLKRFLFTIKQLYSIYTEVLNEQKEVLD